MITRSVAILGIMLTLAGCHHASSAEPSNAPAKSQPMTNNVKLDVAFSKTGSKLHIDYTVTNHTSGKIMLWDQVVTTSGGKLIAAPNAISTKNAGDPDSCSCEVT